MENMELWDKFSRPPADALKKIIAGRLKNFTDVSPSWRIKALTEAFGPCGIGWKFIVKRLWTESGSENQTAAFSEIDLFINMGGIWSEAIPGVGGSMLVVNEKNGPHTSDEAYKMATTDALSVAMKMLGVAADIYAGKWDGSKYIDGKDTPEDDPKEKAILHWKEQVDSASQTMGLDEFKTIWSPSKVQIIAECGEAGARIVYDYYMTEANKKAISEGKSK